MSRKREIRLLKNREAARECRRKKKEYIKCLENRYSAVQYSTVQYSTVQYLMYSESRVAVLENQNKALIEELKSLKELYTGVWVPTIVATTRGVSVLWKSRDKKGQ